MRQQSEAEKLLQIYRKGINLLIEKNTYILLENYEADNNKEKGLLTDNMQFNYGELLMKIVSLNKDAMECMMTFLRTEIRLHQEALPELNNIWRLPESVKNILESKGVTPHEATATEQNEIQYYYQLERIEELYYHINNCLIHNMPLETLENLTQNEIGIITRIFLSECSKIYNAGYNELDDIDDFIPEILWNDDLKKSLKQLLCNPNEVDEKILNDFLFIANFPNKYQLISGELRQIINVRTFSDLIALEVFNIINHVSTIKRYTLCTVCGRLFRQESSKSSKVCGYRDSDGKLCIDKMKDEFWEYQNTLYTRLKSFVNYRGIDAEIYGIFRNKSEELLEIYKERNDFVSFKDELDAWYKELKRKYTNKGK